MSDAIANRIPAELTKRVTDALASAVAVEAVAGEASKAIAAKSLIALSDIVRDGESNRKRLKEPILRMGQDLDSAFGQLLTPLKNEIERLKRLVASYDLEQYKKNQADAKRKEEEARKLLEEAERQKREGETLGVIGDQMGAAAAQASAESLTKDAVAMMTVPEPSKVGPVSSKPKWVFEVTDIKALYAARPDLVKPLEVATSEVNKAISAGLRECAGLRIYEDVKVRIG